MTVDAKIESEEFLWGEDLFNHGYYWEAHEAWEGIWHVSDKCSEIRAVLKGLILLSAAGVKIREGKRTAAMRHAGRAAGLFRNLANGQRHHLERALGIRLDRLAERAETTAAAPPVLLGASRGRPEPVFEFILGSKLAPPNT
ncbi:DUF309 domain-containing protein [Neorhizobium sp. T25_13]|uniref:DUF309 domain-containing protein n=1 Tax=Neorhizobium sp. T25_13 TaxID=2093830 RepID=UPI001FE0A43E|nr:DUF309 domain-containing protein [Neorhizobium sp. T25_13]